MVFAIVRHRHAMATGAVLAAITLPVGMPAAASAAAGARPPGAASARAGHSGGAAGSGTGASLRRVSYRGYVFEVPQSWPVIDLGAHPATCVRFDRHVLYLGRPAAVQACPAAAVGSTEAVLAEPASTTPAAAAPASAGPSRGHKHAQLAQSVEDPVAHRIVVTAPRITVTATYRSGRARILAILTAAGLPEPVIENPVDMLPGNPVPTVPLSATNFTGLGFDACAAPAAQAMRAWMAHSGFQAVGVYIGGADRACAQPNLTAQWVSQQAAAGWHFIPLYVGPQVAFPGEVTAARNEGAAAAQDAVAQAQLLGFGPGTPIYYDMEAFGPSRSRAALKFFSSWTAELHILGYRAAVYSSSDSGILDMVSNFSNPLFTMPDVIYDAWWNGVPDTIDPNVPVTEWASHSRVHQFSGGVLQTHGGYTIDIDQDFLDVQLGGGTGGGGAPAARQASQAVSTTGRRVYAFYAGTDGGLWYTRYLPHAGWSAPAALGVQLAGQPTAMASRDGATVFYRAPNGGLCYLTSSGGSWSGPQAVRMGAMGSGPRVVSTEDGGIAVFWRGMDPAKLWSATYTPGRGWRGPSHVGSGLASEPAPSVSGSGTVSVFWKGTDGQLWYISRGPGQGWSSPAMLAGSQVGTGMGATGQGGGQVGVVWGGTTRGSVWHASYTGQGGWSTASRAGDGMSGEPVAVASSASTENAFWKGQGGRLWHATSRGGASWAAAAPLPLGTVGSGVFAAGQRSGVVDVFWKGSADHHLWHSRYYPRHSWTRPHDLGGNVG